MQEPEKNGPPKASVSAAVDAVADAFAKGRLAAAERAELRRIRPDTLPPAAFWHALARLVEPRHPAPRSEIARTLWERQWATVLSGMALVEHHSARNPGHVLAEAGFHELRLRRLLRATGDRLSDELLSAARFLAAKGLGMDWREGAKLVFYDPDRVPEWADRVRRRIARDYFANLHD